VNGHSRCTPKSVLFTKGGLYFLSEKDVAAISKELESVENWEGLANWLNVGSTDIKTDCAGESSRAACYRRKLVRCYCDSQFAGDPNSVTEDIAKALDKMNLKRQAQQLRNLQFGKWVGKRSSLIVCIPSVPQCQS